MEVTQAAIADTNNEEEDADEHMVEYNGGKRTQIKQMCMKKCKKVRKISISTSCKATFDVVTKWCYNAS
eukprot:6609961-Ditylum_brightwellii.AAC.1